MAIRRKALLGTGLMLAGLVVPIAAHHAVSTVYDLHEALTVAGSIGRVVDRRPHPLVEVVDTQQSGLTRTWAVELDTIEQRTDAATGASLHPGDWITVCGNPGRDPSRYQLRMLILTRVSDGFTLARASAQGVPSGEGCHP